MAVATALWLQSEAYIRLGNSDAAAPRIERGIALIRDVRQPLKLRADLYMARAGVLTERMQAARALSMLQAAHRIFGALGERRSQSMALQNIAILYWRAEDLPRAARYFQQAADTYAGDPGLSLFLHNNRGNVLLKMKRYADAGREYRTALTISRQMPGLPMQVELMANVAMTSISLRQFAAADTLLAQAVRIARRGSDDEGLRTVLGVAAESAFRQGNMRRALGDIKAVFYGVDLGATGPALRDAHDVAYGIYRRLGDDRIALQHLEAVQRLDRESSKVAISTSSALMAARFDYANQELRIANLKAEELRRSAQFQRTLFLSLGGATLVVIVLLSVGIVTLRRSRNQVRAANRDLASTNVALEKALKAKTEFLATTSHEIRTPLNGILGMTQVMLRDPKLAEDLRDRVGIIHDAGTTMRSLVDDILDMAKMETGNLTVEMVPLDLPAALRDVTRMWEEQARAKGLDFRLDVARAPAWIESDPGRLRQIVFNLLSNAIKFTDAGGITVRVETAGADDARRIRLSIVDTGIGIPEEKREEIFESFKQVDAGTTRKYGGTGLGLAICRNLARAMGGDVGIDGAEGVGSTFVVDLPLVLAEAPDVPAVEAGEGTLLILDRNPIARSMLKTLFEPKVARLLFVATPEEAKAALESEAVTVMLADEATLKAGGPDSVAILAELIVTAKQHCTKSAVLWAKPDAEITEVLNATGVSALIAKPVAGPALVEALLTLVQKNANPRESALVSRAA